MVVQPAHQRLHYVFVLFVVPAVGNVHVLALGHIGETVLVVVHREKSLFVVCHQSRCQSAFLIGSRQYQFFVLCSLFFVPYRYLPPAFYVHFGVQFRIEHRIHRYGALALRLDVFHVDLSRNRLIAVDN